MARHYGVILLSFLLMSCTHSINEYEQMSGEFDIRHYFDGYMSAWGIVQDAGDNLTRRFCVDISAQWQENSGVISEKFYFADGEQQSRVWRLEYQPDGTVTGRADDVVGQASGQAVGPVFHWNYTLRVPVDDSEYDMFMDDWMYQLDEQRLFNRTLMKKWGVTVAELSIFFDKSQGLVCQSPDKPVPHLLNDLH